MKRWAQAVLPLLAIVSVFALAACEGDQGPAGPAGVSGTTGCVQCHNDTNVISGKVIQWEESGHGSGESYVRGTRSSCAGCHSGNAFRQMIEGRRVRQLRLGAPERRAGGLLRGRRWNLRWRQRKPVRQLPPAAPGDSGGGGRRDLGHQHALGTAPRPAEFDADGSRRRRFDRRRGERPLHDDRGYLRGLPHGRRGKPHVRARHRSLPDLPPG
jgi:hypothetical protein